MIWWGVLNATLCDKVYQWLTTDLWYFLVLWFPPPIKLTSTIKNIISFNSCLVHVSMLISMPWEHRNWKNTFIAILVILWVGLLSLLDNMIWSRNFFEAPRERSSSASPKVRSSLLFSIGLFHYFSGYDEVYSMQHYVIKFISDLLQICGFSWYYGFLHQ
jgi:hypothetical protein